jgi:fructose-1,6-bisphosphatase II / sedoheptulose-1,7-bisphosphatase
MNEPAMPNRLFVPPPRALDRNLALEVVRVTEASALAAARWVGRGEEKAADQAAAEAMREALNSLSMDGSVVNGEGEECSGKVGTGTGPRLDIVLTAIEGTTICAKAGHNALSVVAATEQGSFLQVPSGVYMEKIAAGPGLPDGLLDLDLPAEVMVARVAEAKGVPVSALTVCMLDRPRHTDMLGRIYDAGARVVLIEAGDVSGAIATGLPETGIDLYMGSGGAAQGVLAAAGLKCLGGRMQCRLLLRNEEERGRARRAGFTELARKFDLDDMVKGHVMFAATGITDGHILDGVTLFEGGAVSHSLVMRSATGTVRKMMARHDFKRHVLLHQDP